MKYICGVDPGLHGCVCLYHPEDIILFDMPIFEITRNGKKKNQIDLYGLAKFIDLHSIDIERAIIENPSAMPGQGATSLFSFGFSCGVAQMAIASAFIPMKLIHPSVWKKKMGLSKDKDASRLRASQIAPQWSGNWSRAKDDGRAESFLIAYSNL